MATKKKLLQAAAGAGGGAALNVEDVFSTYLYTGTNAAQTITNGIDLSGEGGLVWMKSRTTATIGDHALFDSETVTGSTFPVVQKAWVSNDAGVLDGYQPGFTFTSTGFTTAGRSDTDQSGVDYVTWSFRKCPKFFDVVNYTGNSTSGRTISHNLGVVPAMIIVFGPGDNWVYHKDVGNTKYLEINKNTVAQTNSSAWNNTTPTDSVFTVGDDVTVNYSGQQYTAYLFADNDGDGEFGPTGDQDIIKCGSGTIDSHVELGWEPQWVLAKATNSQYDWHLFDSMRGMTPAGLDDPHLKPNSLAAETSSDALIISPTGFTYTYGAAQDFIYIAIRRGPMAVPESATDVFAVDAGNSPTSTAPEYTSNFPVDMAFYRDVTGTMDTRLSSRLTGNKYLRTNLTNAETGLTGVEFDYMDGYFNGALGSNYYAWMWRRAPNFFDVVCYEGTGALTDRTHNLGVKPEMIWIKSRSGSYPWFVFYNFTSTTLDRLYLNTTAAATTSGSYSSGYGIQEEPTDTKFVSSPYNNANWNGSGSDYIAYLFASLDGVSKVGSYTGNGSSQTIGCGFSSGARFVLIKRTDSTGDWYIWDTERGIVAANDPHLSLNSTAAEVTTDDSIDPVSSGFAVNQVSATNINVSSASYIFYAVS